MGVYPSVVKWLALPDLELGFEMLHINTHVGPASSPTNLSLVCDSSSVVVSFQPPVYGAECVDYYTVTAISEGRNVTCAARVTVVGSVGLSVNQHLMESSARATGIKAVLFDVGGVLFSPPQGTIAEVEQDLGPISL